MNSPIKIKPEHISASKKTLHVIAAGMTTLLLAPAVQSASLTINDAPLFQTTAVSPNVFFEVDDSGSMDWEILTVKHWRACDYDKDAPNDTWDQAGDTCSSSRRDDGLWHVWTGVGSDADTFEYIYVNSDNSYDQSCDDDDDRQTLFSCGSNLATNEPYQSDWRIFSSDFNVLFYNPSETYTPWTGPCLTSGGACTDASFSSAKSDPRQGKDGYTVTKDLDGFIYEVWSDTAGYSGSQPERGGDINDTATPNSEIDLWDKHASYKISGNNIVVTTTTYSPNSSGLNPTTSSYTLTGGPHAELGDRTVSEVKQNIANWYSYFRKRSFIAKAGISGVLDQKPTFRYGLDTINEAASFVEIPATVGDYTQHNSDLLAALYDTVWPSSGTPLRTGLERAGEYYDGNLTGKSSPILDTCQKNYSVLITDGYWNGGDPSVGNADGDGYSNTVADVAKYYHNIDFDSTLANEVPADACDQNNIRCDTEDRQHMVTYTLAFGVEGNLVDTSANDWPNPLLTESGNWGDPTIDDSPGKIDDLWHAAWNSYGKYINVSTPSQAVKGLSDTIADVDNRRGAASSVALNSGFIGAGANIYQALFNGEDWSGELKAIPITSSGIPGTPPILGTPIRASVVMPDASARSILTYDGTDGVAFQWDQLSASQQALLDPLETDPNASSNDTLNYIRGDVSQEIDNGGAFRVRPKTKVIENNATVAIKPLGDIINSNPAFSGSPRARYPDVWAGSAAENCPTCQTYTQFRAAQVNRTPMVYVGTNAGYLSGFHADTLVEQMAYIPSPVIKNLSALTDANYTHQYYVDGSPTVIDVFFKSDNKWHTVLVAGLNKGGQGIYALDVTDPSSFAETGTAPADTVLWEFNDSDDVDLGYTYSRPSIVRMSNGDWAAVFGNGYNNRDADGNRSTTGDAVLYIVNIEDGSLIRKITTTVGSTGTPNGLATPAVIDKDGDFIADYIYAGDLKGNMWKFDVTSSDPLVWDVAFYNTATPPVPKPLYIAKDSGGTRQPITTSPVVGRGPNGLNFMVYFGTGIYLGSPDLTDTSTQTFYGILDKGTRFTGRTKLVAQTVDFQDSNFRTTSENPQTSTSRGWYMDLPDSGERSISNAILRSGRLIFVTAIPDPDICSAGGDSWLMELDALTGAVPLAPPFDINNDGVFTVADFIDTDADTDKDSVADGIKFGGGIVTTPGIITDSAVDAEHKITSNSNGNLVLTTESLGSRVGRQSWSQLR